MKKNLIIFFVFSLFFVFFPQKVWAAKAGEACPTEGNVIIGENYDGTSVCLKCIAIPGGSLTWRPQPGACGANPGGAKEGYACQTEGQQTWGKDKSEKTACLKCTNGYWAVSNDSSCGVPEGGGSDIINPVVGLLGVGAGADIIAKMVANGLKVAFSVSGLILLAMLLWGGISWMTAGGDKEALAKAQSRVTSALIGFAVFMSVFAIINFIAPILGLDFLQILKIEWPTP